MNTRKVRRKRSGRRAKRFSSLDQFASHYFPKQPRVRPPKDGKRRGTELAERVLADIVKDLRHT